MIRFHDVPFTGDAVAIQDGKFIWHNFHSGDCPPDIEMLYVKYMYAYDGVIVFVLTDKED